MRDRITLLDGATGTELSRRGHDTRLPLWSARPVATSPDAVTAIHRDYVRAGADVLTTCTFRTNRRSLRLAGWEGRAAELTSRAVQCARQAIEAEGRPRVRVAGGVAPLEDCFRPDLVPDDGALHAEQTDHVANLVAAGVDLILVETMNCRREAEAAVRAGVAAGVETWCSFVTDGGGRLLSGESLADAARSVAHLGASAVLVNCGPAVALASEVAVLAAVMTTPFGGYGNIGHAHDVDGWQVDLMLAPAEFAAAMLACRDEGATLLGGCCGTQPEHIAALARALT